MKKIFFPLALTLAVMSCTQTPNNPEAQTAETQEASTGSGTNYTVDTATSVVGFLGTKPVGTHTGEFKLNDGAFTLADGGITSGKFTVNVAGFKVTDKDFPYAEKLKGHLLSDDFFGAEKYPTATFEVTGSEAVAGDANATHKISGNLTLRDSTKNVTFPAKVTVAENTLSATAQFNIDRTQWGLFYGNDKSLGDKFISPEVQITLNINAKK